MVLTEVACGKRAKHEAGGRVPKEAGSKVHIPTPAAHPTANCEEHSGLWKNVIHILLANEGKPNFGIN